MVMWGLSPSGHSWSTWHSSISIQMIIIKPESPIRPTGIRD